MTTLQKVFNRVTGSLVTLGSWIFFLFMFNVVADVTGRYLFGKPITGTMEIGMVVLAFAIFLSLASVQGRDQHIKVSMLLGRFPWLKNWSDGITLIVGFSLLLLMTWYGLPFALRSFAVKESSPIIPVPIYLGKFAFFVGCAMFCIQFSIQLLSRLFTRPVSGVPSGKEEG